MFTYCHYLLPLNLGSLGHQLNFDLVNLNIHLHEISNIQKLKNEDVAYIEKEFNNLILEDGYESLFNFLKLKEFIRLVVIETN